MPCSSKLIRSDDEVVYGDSGFVGIQKRPEIKENEHLASIDYRTSPVPASTPTWHFIPKRHSLPFFVWCISGSRFFSAFLPYRSPTGKPAESIRQCNRLGAVYRSIARRLLRCKVEHVFRIVKRQFGYAKTAYRGLQKNANRLYALFLSSNLYMLARAGRTLQKLEIA